MESADDGIVAGEVGSEVVEADSSSLGEPHDWVSSDGASSGLSFACATCAAAMASSSKAADMVAMIDAVLICLRPLVGEAGPKEDWHPGFGLIFSIFTRTTSRPCLNDDESARKPGR